MAEPTSSSNVTSQVLQILEKHKSEPIIQKVESDWDQDEHEEVNHVDERWLVSYADMMTLLFGLFVMLYSMQNKFEQIKQAASKTFGDQAPAVQAGVPGAVPSAAISGTATAQPSAMPSMLQPSGIPSAAASAIPSISNMPESGEPPEVKIKKMKREVTKAHETAATANFAVTSLTTMLDNSQKKVHDLEEQIKVLSRNHSSQQKSFLSVVIRWATRDHDIDLVVQDPSGFEFNFKKRKFPNHPGEFTLDTRRGPGAEIWQSDQIIPGLYKIKYEFYNQYGNIQPTLVSGTVYTPVGVTNFEDMQMDFVRQKTIYFTFMVNKMGEVSQVKRVYGF